MLDSGLSSSGTLLLATLASLHAVVAWWARFRLGGGRVSAQNSWAPSLLIVDLGETELTE